MPVFSIIPKTRSTEQTLAMRMGRLREDFKKEVLKVAPQLREADVHVNLLNCPFRDTDDAAPDVYIYADACPNPGLESSVNGLIEELALILYNHGFSWTIVEAWIRFLPGAWRQACSQGITDSVDHQVPGIVTPEQIKARLDRALEIKPSREGNGY